MTRQMKLTLLVIGVGSLLTIATPTISQANSRNCAERAKVMAQLTDRFGETRQSIGMASNNTFIEVFASDSTGTWSITATMPNGVTCMIASGQSFETLAQAPVPQGSKL